jgi:biotin carboxyl carrier protein
VSDLTPDDVREILRLVEESDVEELELETPRFSVRFRRGDLPQTRAGGDAGLAGLAEVTAPMPGRFYRAPAPGENVFVDVGSEVDPETQVCILEVMKLMNAVHAGVTGVVAEVCRADGDAVEYGVRVRPG